MGEASTWVDASDMKRVTGSKYYLSGLLTPKTITIQAAAYTRGFALGVAEKVDIFEKTTVIALERSNILWQARTPKDPVKASKVILSVNGYLQSFGFMQSSLMHIFLFASMTRAMSTVEVNNLGGEPSWGIVPAN